MYSSFIYGRLMPFEEIKARAPQTHSTRTTTAA